MGLLCWSERPEDGAGREMLVLVRGIVKGTGGGCNVTGKGSVVHGCANWMDILAVLRWKANGAFRRYSSI